jgi:hypothetical protein
MVQITVVDSRPQFSPDKSRLDSLAETYFVCDQQASRRRFQERQHGFVLMRVKIGVGGVHAVDEVGKPNR